MEDKLSKGLEIVNEVRLEEKIKNENLKKMILEKENLYPYLNLIFLYLFEAKNLFLIHNFDFFPIILCFLLLIQLLKI